MDQRDNRRPDELDGVVLIHGAGSDVTDSFGPTSDWLRNRWPVLAHQLPGSGGRAEASAIDPDVVVEEIRRETSAIGFRRYAVIGSSTGSALAVKLAAAAPDEVVGVVATVGFARADSSLRLALQVWRDLLAHPDPVAVGRYLALINSGPDWLRSVAPRTIDALAREIAAALPAGTAAQLELALSIDVRAELPELSVPVLVIAGRDDRMVPPALSDELGAAIADATVVRIPSGHGWSVEAPQEWWDLVAPFLDRLTSR